MSYDAETGEAVLHRIEAKTGKKLFLKSWPRRTGKGRRDECTTKCYRCGRLGHMSGECTHDKHKGGSPFRKKLVVAAVGSKGHSKSQGTKSRTEAGSCEDDQASSGIRSTHHDLIPLAGIEICGSEVAEDLGASRPTTRGAPPDPLGKAGRHLEAPSIPGSASSEPPSTSCCRRRKKPALFGLPSSRPVRQRARASRFCLGVALLDCQLSARCAAPKVCMGDGASNQSAGRLLHLHPILLFFFRPATNRSSASSLPRQRRLPQKDFVASRSRWTVEPASQ